MIRARPHLRDSFEVGGRTVPFVMFPIVIGKFFRERLHIAVSFNFSDDGRRGNPGAGSIPFNHGGDRKLRNGRFGIEKGILGPPIVLSVKKNGIGAQSFFFQLGEGVRGGAAQGFNNSDLIDNAGGGASYRNRERPVAGCLVDRFAAVRAQHFRIA